MDNLEISKVNILNDYLSLLGDIKNNYLIILSIKDTMGAYMTPAVSEKIVKNLGLVSYLSNYKNQAYLAIIHRGIVLHEELSTGSNTVKYTDRINKIPIYVLSSLYDDKNRSIIKINGVDHSINIRGLNIVIYDTEKERVYDSVCFDTHTRELKAYRLQDKVLYFASNAENQLFELRNNIKTLSNDIKKLKTTIETNNYKSQLLLWHIIKLAGDTQDINKARLDFYRSIPPAEGYLRKKQMAVCYLMNCFATICDDCGIDYWLSFGTLLGAFRHGGFIPWDNDTDVCMTRDQYEIFTQKIVSYKEKYKIEIRDFFAIYNGSTGGFNHCYQVAYTQGKTPYTLDIFIFDYVKNNSRKLIDSVNELKIELKNEAKKLCKKNNMPAGDFNSNDIIFRELWDTYYKKYNNLIDTVDKTDYIMWSIDNLNLKWMDQRILRKDCIYPLTNILFEKRLYKAPQKIETILELFYGDYLELPDDVIKRKSINMTKEELNILEGLIKE